jgi:hypothetical protein
VLRRFFIVWHQTSFPRPRRIELGAEGRDRICGAGLLQADATVRAAREAKIV